MIRALIALGLCQYALGYGGGAPYCTKAPNHGSSSRAQYPSQKPHKITLGVSCYSPRQQIDVTLETSSSSSDSFHGFVLEAVKSSNSNRGVGRFSRTRDSHNIRGACGAYSVTHKSSGPKSSITAKWTAPTSNEGTVKFSATTFVSTTNRASTTGNYYPDIEATLNPCASASSSSSSNNNSSNGRSSSSSSAKTCTRNDRWNDWCQQNARKDNCRSHNFGKVWCQKTCCLLLTN